MATAVNTLVSEVQTLLVDTDEDRWDSADLIVYLNLAQNNIAMRTVALRLHPAKVTTEAVKLAAGSTQNLRSLSTTTSGLAILDITKNLGREWITGTTYGVDDMVYESGTRYVCTTRHTAGTFATDRDTNSYWTANPVEIKEGTLVEQINKDNFAWDTPNWISREANDDSTVDYWMVMENDKKGFYVYPQQPATGREYVEMTYACLPPAVAAGDNIGLDDEYKEAIMDFILYKAFSKDDEISDSEGSPRAITYYQAYINNPVFLI